MTAGERLQRSTTAPVSIRRVARIADHAGRRHTGLVDREETVDPITDLLRSARTVAVVGCSPKPHRDSHRVAAYLQRAGYRIAPVNPRCDEILGETCYPDLESVPEDVEVDVVDVFRRSEHVPPIVDAAIARGVDAVWLQLGVTHPEAEARAREAGLQVVSDHCLKIEHSRRFGD